MIRREFLKSSGMLIVGVSAGALVSRFAAARVAGEVIA